MEALIEEIVQKLYFLPESKILEILDFVEFLAWHKEPLASRQLENELLREDEEFEAIADRLADTFQMCVGATIPALSDHAVSRAGIYEEHP
ncbi:MAG: hypothetical protein VKJ46_13695 [Leptolyngbyaceae bacterium]|nr:hypothetical protein [Leptolyngbyaceae bacterium]